jgi:uncharacterized protein YoxC
MFEYIQFYTKNISNFTLLLIVGVVIAILDITIRNVVKDVYLNVRENMAGKRAAGKEGLVNKNAKSTGDGTGDGTGAGDAGGCPKTCNEVEALRTRLTGLIENAARLQQDIQKNSVTITRQQFLIQQMQKSVQKIVEKSK